MSLFLFPFLYFFSESFAKADFPVERTWSNPMSTNVRKGRRRDARTFGEVSERAHARAGCVSGVLRRENASQLYRGLVPPEPRRFEPTLFSGVHGRVA